jgi:hypothetical protein
MTLLQLGFNYLPFMNRLFASAPITAGSWIGIGAASLLTFAVIEVEKSFERRRAGARAAH